jgi:acyl-CoA synthetase (AMP-forming)/AMP-acid ligase II
VSVTRRSLPAGLVHVVRAELERDPDSAWCHFLPDGQTVGRTVTRRELDDQCRRVAVLLSEFVRPGDRLLVMCEPGIDYVAAFFGCLYAGAIPVPAYPPSPTVLERSLQRLEAVVRDADPAYALTTRQLAPVLDAAPLRRADGSVVRHVCVDDAVTPADAWDLGAVGAGQDVAFLQYTSGSTGSPKGVVVRHDNLLANLEMIATAYGDIRGETVSTWLPPYHDMGLIGMIMWPLVAGARLVMMPPEAFLRRPDRWVSAMSDYGVRVTASPNFGFQLAARRTRQEQADGLDLSALTVAINGAEPVTATAMAAFSERFAGAGFRPQGFRPSYGMAEATLLISTTRWTTTKRADADALSAGRFRASECGAAARDLVSCGTVPQGHALVVLRPGAEEQVPDGCVGELVVRGPHVTSGYWGSGAGNHGAEGLRTGDLGLVIDGEVFVTGRLKDLLVVRGRNHYPQDLELTAEQAHPGVRPGCVAAFGVEAGDAERVVLVLESDGADPTEISAAVSQAVNEHHGVRPREVVVVEQRTIPKTSSGKIQRSATRAAYLAGELSTARAIEAVPAG